MVSRRWTSSGRMRTTLIGVAWVALIGCGDTASRNNWTTVRDTLPSGAVPRHEHPGGGRVPPCGRWSRSSALTSVRQPSRRGRPGAFRRAGATRPKFGRWGVGQVVVGR